MAGIFTRDSIINLVVFGLLVATAIGAHLAGNGFAVTLATKAAILGLAGVGLNLALGYGGMVSFGHAAFFGIGGYVTGIFASHAAQGTPVTREGREVGFVGTAVRHHELGLIALAVLKRNATDNLMVGESVVAVDEH